MLQLIIIYIIIFVVVVYSVYRVIKTITDKKQASACDDCSGCALKAECQSQVCPVEKAGLLDNPLRRWFQQPRKILAPYIHSGMNVLDFGCGPGVFTLEIARLLNGSGQVIAADVQKGMLDQVSAKLKKYHFESVVKTHLCKTTQLNLNLSVDFILAFYVVHEVPDQKSLFESFKSALKKEGLILIVEPKFHVSQLAFDAMVEKLQKAGFKIVDTPRIRFSRAVLLKHKIEA